MILTLMTIILSAQYAFAQSSDPPQAEQSSTSGGASNHPEYTLGDLYRIALERSEQIKISEEDLYIAERGKEKALSVLLPKLSIFWDYTKYSEDKTSAFGESLVILQPDYSTSWGLRLDQSMSLSGREITAFRISKKIIEKSGYDLYAVREGYLFSVASAYYDVLRAENNYSLTKAVLSRAVGLVGDYDVKEPDLKGEPEEYVLFSLKEKAFSERAELKSMNLQKKITEVEVKYA